MAGQITSVLILGLGKVGQLVATLLHDSGFLVAGGDRLPPTGMPFPVHTAEATDPSTLEDLLAHHDAVVGLPVYRSSDLVSREIAAWLLDNVKRDSREQHTAARA